jgi:hypothetical protein
MSKLSANLKGDWPAIIKAQDEASNFVIQQEKELKKQSKFRYKEELDRQIQAKHKTQQQIFDTKDEEREFLKLQSEALRKYEADKKVTDREYVKFFSSENREEEHNKRKKYYLSMQREKELEQKRIQDVLHTEKQRKTEEALHKMSVKKEQQRILDLQIEERQQRFGKELEEKVNDKRNLEKIVEEMRLKEQSYRDFYDKRMAQLEQKSRVFQPVLDKGRTDMDLINKRTEEYERTTKVRDKEKEMKEAENRKQVTYNLKYELERQIQEKNQRRLFEVQEGLKEQEMARNRAREEESRKAKETSDKRRQMQDLKYHLEKQLSEKEKELNKSEMDARNRQINREILERVVDKRPVAFPGIPGVGSSNSPLKHSFDRVLQEPVYSRTPDRYGKAEKSRENSDGHGVSRSMALYQGKHKVFGDPSKHDPIVNPIGSSLPKVLPGQRIARGGNSSLVAMASHIIGS